MKPAPQPCPKQQELIAETQKFLIQLAELARQEADALAAGDNDSIMLIDKEIESTLGDKERTMGALHRHQREHGC